MKLDPGKVALAAVLTTTILWIICSLVVAIFPGGTMHASGYMTHSDFSGMRWDMHLTGFVFGLIIWDLVVAVAGWGFATIYNRLL